MDEHNWFRFLVVQAQCSVGTNDAFHLRQHFVVGSMPKESDSNCWKSAMGLIFFLIVADSLIDPLTIRK